MFRTLTLIVAMASTAIISAAFAQTSTQAPPRSPPAVKECPAGHVWDEKRKICVVSPRGSYNDLYDDKG